MFSKQFGPFIYWVLSTAKTLDAFIKVMYCWYEELTLNAADWTDFAFAVFSWLNIIVLSWSKSYRAKNCPLLFSLEQGCSASIANWWAENFFWHCAVVSLFYVYRTK